LLALKDSNYNIKRLVGADAFPHVVALLGEPDVNSGMTLCVASEDDARTTYDEPEDGEKAARGWRLTLATRCRTWLACPSPWAWRPTAAHGWCGSSRWPR
jgi:hypothetical protein